MQAKRTELSVEPIAVITGSVTSHFCCVADAPVVQATPVSDLPAVLHPPPEALSTASEKTEIEPAENSADADVLCSDSLKIPPDNGMSDVAILCFALSKNNHADAAMLKSLSFKLSP
jgi:hypothetical protein